MGIYLNDYLYYENGGVSPLDANHGSYQYISLQDMVRNFMEFYVGEGKDITRITRSNVIYHMKQAIKRLNYDALKEVRALELEVCDNLKFIMPSDYVNWVRVSILKDGLLYKMEENKTAMTSNSYLQDENCDILFDQNGEIMSPEMSDLEIDRIKGLGLSVYQQAGSPYDGHSGYCYDGNWYFGGSFGADQNKAFSGTNFWIDRRKGTIEFDSTASDQTVIVEYISDGMEQGQDGEININKLFERYVMLETLSEIANNSSRMNMTQRRNHQRRATAELRNARIRISDINPGKILGSMRGRRNQIK